MVVDDLPSNVSRIGDARDMTGDGDLRVRPEGMLRGERLLAKHVQASSGKMSTLKSLDQVRVNEMVPSSNVNHKSAFGEELKCSSAENILCVRCERKKADKYGAVS